MTWGVINAQFNSRCWGCKGEIKAGEQIAYDRENKRGAHMRCRPPEQRDIFDGSPDPEQVALADKLKFRPHDELINE